MQRHLRDPEAAVSDKTLSMWISAGHTKKAATAAPAPMANTEAMLLPVMIGWKYVALFRVINVSLRGDKFCGPQSVSQVTFWLQMSGQGELGMETRMAAFDPENLVPPGADGQVPCPTTNF